jgi:DNA helicase-2/ATP-dependent DNA helicase PcrA
MEDALRKRDIPYRIYGGLSFIKGKIKDVLCYLRLVINPKMKKLLVRVINYPARIEIQQSKNLRLLPITTNVPSGK